MQAALCKGSQELTLKDFARAQLHSILASLHFSANTSLISLDCVHSAYAAIFIHNKYCKDLELYERN